MKKKTPRKGFENYELVQMPDVVTFGTSLFMRNDHRALKIVFPAGQMVTFAPMDEIAEEKDNTETGALTTNDQAKEIVKDMQKKYKKANPPL